MRAEEALRIRDEFLSIASHELKTPLTSLQIELYSMRERLAGREPEDWLSRKLDRAARNADRLSGLIDTLLDVARIATGRLTLKPERFDLAESVRLVIDGMRGTATRAGCELVFDAANTPAVTGRLGPAARRAGRDEPAVERHQVRRRASGDGEPGGSRTARPCCW